ncbi:XRE family transcriptional regulator [Enterocloster aldenensis]|uniref:helix-turn-helix domain-containing protein n=1 Tax=Enterocloster aldenensis TaxID=358742 RepID=UPI000E50A0B3|nr:XRE family transcriptional regulator [Enterocloster aldenensis]
MNGTYYNNRVEYLMDENDISLTQLSRLTGIPATTLNRIIKGKVKKPKRFQLDRISEALGKPIHELFDIPEFKKNEVVLTEPIEYKNEFHFGIHPDEAGKIVKVLLTEEESLLLYLFQISSLGGKQKILNIAKKEAESFSKKLFEKMKQDNSKPNDNTNFYQLHLDL